MKYTKEDLMNTWGVVESKEHAEYIVRVADSTGFSFPEGGNAVGGFFAFSNVILVFLASDCIASSVLKKIKIPLPPKAKEWPQVGDEVLLVSMGMTTFNKTVSITYMGDGVGCYKDLSNGNEYTFSSREAVFKKPKSKQDLLIEELHQKLLANNCSYEYLLACDIVQGKIEGLSYSAK